MYNLYVSLNKTLIALMIVILWSQLKKWQMTLKDSRLREASVKCAKLSLLINWFPPRFKCLNESSNLSTKSLTKAGRAHSRGRDRLSVMHCIWKKTPLGQTVILKGHCKTILSRLMLWAHRWQIWEFMTHFHYLSWMPFGSNYNCWCYFKVYTRGYTSRSHTT